MKHVSILVPRGAVALGCIEGSYILLTKVNDFLAARGKAPLFDVPVFGAVLRALGMVPAYRGSDDAKQVTKNLESLEAAARQLAAGAVMGIFPEGKSHDAAQLALARVNHRQLAQRIQPMLPLVQALLEQDGALRAARDDSAALHSASHALDSANALLAGYSPPHPATPEHAP